MVELTVPPTPHPGALTTRALGLHRTEARTTLIVTLRDHVPFCHADAHAEGREATLEGWLVPRHEWGQCCQTAMCRQHHMLAAGKTLNASVESTHFTNPLGAQPYDPVHDEVGSSKTLEGCGRCF